MSFIEELLAESEAKDKVRLAEMNKIRADHMLLALMVLQNQANDINAFADAEVALVEDYRKTELEKIEKKASWMSYQLEQFIRSTNDKTIRLPHGTIRLRLGRDKVEIVEPEKFLPIAQKKGLLRQVPESFEPDLSKIQAYIKSTGVIPLGVKFTPAQTRFSYTTKDEENGQEEAKAGTPAEGSGNGQAG